MKIFHAAAISMVLASPAFAEPLVRPTGEPHGAAMVDHGVVTMAPAAPQCPTPGEPCKILYLTPQEEKLLMSPNGVLDTAAQARALDLGQFAVYFKTRIAASPQGEVVQPAKPDAPAK